MVKLSKKAVKWGKRGARINDIAPSIIVTPLAIDEFNGPRGDFYKKIVISSFIKNGNTKEAICHHGLPVFIFYNQI